MLGTWETIRSGGEANANGLPMSSLPVIGVGVEGITYRGGGGGGGLAVGSGVGLGVGVAAGAEVGVGAGVGVTVGMGVGGGVGASVGDGVEVGEALAAAAGVEVAAGIGVALVLTPAVQEVTAQTRASMTSAIRTMKCFLICSPAFLS